MESKIALAQRLIQNAGLCYQDFSMVESFITCAKDSEEAARFLLKVCEDDQTGEKFGIFVQDWKTLVKYFFNANPRSPALSRIVKGVINQRDDNRCCITETRHWFWNDCDVFPIIPLTVSCLRDQRGKPLYDLLGAFISPIQRDILLSDGEGTLEDNSRNYWVLNKDIAKSFSRGELSLKDKGANKYEVCYRSIGGRCPYFYTVPRVVHWESNLKDHSNSAIASPDPVLLEIHHRFAIALKWTYIAANMRLLSPKSRMASSTNEDEVKNFIRNAVLATVLAIWLRFPPMIRHQTYRLLKILGLYMYPEVQARGVYRLPLGMYLKYGFSEEVDRHVREFEGLKLVRERTSIPVPYPIDQINSSTYSLLVTSRMEGERAGHALQNYSDEEMDGMANQLRTWIAELHAIEKPADSKFDILSVCKGPILDYRLGDSVVGPFKNEKDFSESMRLGSLPGLEHRHDHEILFAHADLSMRNILTKDGVITGIVDWENAGWYPAYWEYTKCHFA